MPKFCVRVREVYVRKVFIRAEDYQEAIKKVSDGEGDWDKPELLYVMEKEDWEVEESGEFLYRN